MGDLLFLESFDHLSKNTLLRKWTLNPYGPSNIVTGRTGNGLQMGWPASIRRSFSVQDILTVGGAFKFSDLGQRVFLFGNSFTGLKIELIVHTDGRVTIGFNSGTLTYTPTAISRPLISENEWFYIEFQVEHINPPGTGTMAFIIKINEEVVAFGSIAGIAHMIEEGFSYFEFKSTIGIGAYLIDDVYASQDEFLGDVRIYVIRPNGDSTPSEWDASNAGAHYAEVDDINPDDLSSYLYTATVDEIDMVTLEDISFTGEIRGIQLNYIVQKSDAGLGAFKSEINVSGSDYEDSVDNYVSYLAWIDYRVALRKNPVTSNNFTVAEINDMTMGIKRTL